MSINIQQVLLRVYDKPLHLQADLAREKAKEVAALASMGYITSVVRHGEFGGKWRVTATGITALVFAGLL